MHIIRVLGMKRLQKNGRFRWKKWSGWAHSTCIIIFLRITLHFCELPLLRPICNRTFFAWKDLDDHKNRERRFEIKYTTKEGEKRNGNLKKNMRQRVRKTPAAVRFECFNRSTFLKFWLSTIHTGYMRPLILITFHSVDFKKSIWSQPDEHIVVSSRSEIKHL